MNEELAKIKGKKITKVNPINDEEGELWRLQFIFEDETEFNVYMCNNAGYYMDFEYNIKL